MSERDLLLEFASGCTLAALPGHKMNPEAVHFSTRAFLLGDSLNYVNVAMLTACSLIHWGCFNRMPSVQQVNDGSANQLLCWHAPDSCKAPRLLFVFNDIQLVTALLFSRVDHRGTDVRLATQELLQPI